MTNTEKLKKSKKYTINKYINTANRLLIENHLSISQPTFSRKTNVLIGEKGGFEICQLKQIADILERDLMELLTEETKIYFGFSPSDKL